MLRATMKSLLAHKVRLALTALSIVLGVAFVTGTLVLTDTMQSTFDELVQTTTAGVDVSISREQPFGNTQGGAAGATERPLLDAADVDTIAAVDGVAHLGRASCRERV